VETEELKFADIRKMAIMSEVIAHFVGFATGWWKASWLKP
jgi:hypothetical protein